MEKPTDSTDKIFTVETTITNEQIRYCNTNWLCYLIFIGNIAQKLALQSISNKDVNNRDDNQPVNNIPMNLFPVLRIVGSSNVTLNIGKSCSSNINATPNSNWAIEKHRTIIEWPLHFTHATSLLLSRYNCKSIVLKEKNFFIKTLASSSLPLLSPCSPMM